jgi:parallel beta-helix repeat protein
MYNESSSPTVTNCTFSGNSSEGMFNYRSSPTVSNCTFSDNSADWGGGMHNYSESHPTVTNCMFSGNYAVFHGGGMHNSWWCNPRVINCTFSVNSASSGGGVYNFHYSSPIIANCILWGDIGGEIYNNDNCSPIVTYSDMQGGYPGVGNIDANPLFFTFIGFDYFLGPGSPCIDAGIPYTSMHAPTVDGISDWHPRWPNWLPNGTRADMGAYGGPGNVGWLPQ